MLCTSSSTYKSFTHDLKCTLSNQTESEYLDKKLLPMVVSAIAVATFALTVFCVGYMGISRQLAVIKPQLAAVKSQTDSSRKFIPLLFGARYVEIRKHLILHQIQEADTEFMLIIGDSIVEDLHMPSLGGLPVISAGIGGGGVTHVKELVANIPAGKPVKGLVIATGVNDTPHGKTSPDYFDNWSAALKKIIFDAKQLASNQVGVCTIIPVEKGKPMGDQSFDPEKIKEINRRIRGIARETNTHLIDHDSSFANLTSAGIEYTTDGVHLNNVGYRLMKENIRKAANENFAMEPRAEP
jgi:lysophospholipase L1-like esterase